jgi:hypothetical protein
MAYALTCAVFVALATLVAGCGSDRVSGTRVVVTGAPERPIAPGERIELRARALYVDGSEQDITAVATWLSSDRSVASVDERGVLSALAPGRAVVSAAYEGAVGSVDVVVAALPAAYFFEDVEYAFEYELDALGRVASYRIARRPDVAYGSEPWQEMRGGECRGDLRGTYACSSPTGSMRGEAGRVVATAHGKYPLATATSYRYGTAGLERIDTTWEGPGSHDSGKSSSDLAYDGRARLVSVSSDSAQYSLGGTVGRRTLARIAVDALGRLSRAEVTGASYCTPSSLCGGGGPIPPETIEWTYDARGSMIAAGTTVYEVDAEGWLAGRRETRSDSYGIVRLDGKVAEERFTQAEPHDYYLFRGAQRVRYEWGRLPSEPLFVPRALGGLQGADYFGVLSSHHR